METPSLQGNWVDFIILAVFAFFISEAWRFGFWVILADFFAFLLSLVLALRGYSFISVFLRSNFSLPHSVSNALGFLFTAALTETALSLIFARLLAKVPRKLSNNVLSKLAAVIPAVGQGAVFISFILTLVIGLPVFPTIKLTLTESKIGGFLLKNTLSLEARVNEVFGGLIEDSLSYLTVKPGSKESIPISVDRQVLSVDETSEAVMFKLVNEERLKIGLGTLEWRSEIVPVAREHARDMWEREYFGHVSPDGEDVGGRLDRAGVDYQSVGENLALAPTVSTAHQGLMNSEGHRENILSSDFNRVGIGVIDNGVYGKMFVQVFTN